MHGDLARLCSREDLVSPRVLIQILLRHSVLSSCQRQKSIHVGELANASIFLVTATNTRGTHVKQPSQRSNVGLDTYTGQVLR
jgi:hypothetical protein